MKITFLIIWVEKLEGLDFSEGLRNISLTSKVFDLDHFKKVYVRSTWETLDPNVYLKRVAIYVCRFINFFINTERS